MRLDFWIFGNGRVRGAVEQLRVAMPKAGKRYVVFSAYRRWCKWTVSWADPTLITLPEIRARKAKLAGV